jgi:hypothetical protein
MRAEVAAPIALIAPEPAINVTTPAEFIFNTLDDDI